MTVFIIAEAGVNHNGDKESMLKLVDAAKEVGASAIKFQTYKTENLVTINASKAQYQKVQTDPKQTQYEMLKHLELSESDHHELLAYCNKKNIEFMSSAFDLDSFHFLVNEIGLERLKIPSGEITNAPLLLAHSQTKLDIILSTGMSTLDEIKEALGVLAFGLTNGKNPSKKNFKAAYSSNLGKSALKEKVSLLQCTTEYPAPANEINLKSMETLRETFNLKVGLSDHSNNDLVPITAVALGASIIEKHFTLDKNMEGPDHQASMLPDEFKNMVQAINVVETIMGNELKQPTSSELGNRIVARKSLVAARDINNDEKFSSSNLTTKRPGSGISPMEYWTYLNKRSQKAYKADQLIEKINDRDPTDE